jgi:hypothetical protein
MKRAIAVIIPLLLLVSTLSLTGCKPKGSYRECAAKCDDKFADYYSEEENLKRCKRKCVKRYS